MGSVSDKVGIEAEDGDADVVVIIEVGLEVVVDAKAKPVFPIGITGRSRGRYD